MGQWGGGESWGSGESWLAGWRKPAGWSGTEGVVEGNFFLIVVVVVVVVVLYIHLFVILGFLSLIFEVSFGKNVVSLPPCSWGGGEFDVGPASGQ